jgi:excisionase family DNA binding protein
MDSWEKMLSVKEVAARFGISCDSIRRMIRRKEMKSWRMPQPSGRRKRVYTVHRIPESEAWRIFKAFFGK